MKKEYITAVIISIIVIPLIIIFEAAIMLSGHMTDKWLAIFTQITDKVERPDVVIVTPIVCFISGIFFGAIASVRTTFKDLWIPAAIAGAVISTLIMLGVNAILPYVSNALEREGIDTPITTSFTAHPGFLIAAWLLWTAWYLFGSWLGAYCRQKFFQGKKNAVAK